MAVFLYPLEVVAVVAVQNLARARDARVAVERVDERGRAGARHREDDEPLLARSCERAPRERRGELHGQRMPDPR